MSNPSWSTSFHGGLGRTAVRTKNTLPNIFAEVSHHAFRAQQNRSSFDSCVELRLGNTQAARTLRPTSGFEQVDAMEKMSTRRALPGKHASSVIAVGVHARCLHAPLLRDHLHEPAVTQKVSNQTLEHPPCSLIRFCHGPCHLFYRLLHIHTVDRHVARIVALLNVDALSFSSLVSICGFHTCTFTAEMPLLHVVTV